MATILTLPIELQEKIATYLLAADAAVLSLTCRSLTRRLGQNNQSFWYTAHRRSNPDTTKPLDPGEDYWAKAVRVFSGLDKWFCRLCLKDITDLEPKVGVTYIDFWEFKLHYPEIPTTIPASPLSQKYTELEIIPISTAVRLIESYHGTNYESAISPEARLRFKWVRARGEEEAELTHQTLMFMKGIYTEKYRHLHMVLHPDEYYNAFAKSLCYYILLSKPAKDKEHKTPPRSVAEKIMETAELFKAGGDHSLLKQSQAAQFVDSLHTHLFGGQDEFCLDYLVRYETEFLNTLSYGSCGVFLQHMRYKQRSPERNRGEVFPGARCYWCLRERRPEEMEDTDRLPSWNDIDGRRSKNIPGTKYMPAPSFVEHIIVDHREMMWKRPRSAKSMDRWGPRHGEGKKIRSSMDFWPIVLTVMKAPPDIESEVLEDIPEEIYRFRPRISRSEYFHWV
ncbi:hypothetical protein TWF281_001296 [Arthrobotrys megalospora]